MHREIWLRPFGQMLPPALSTPNASLLVLLLASFGMAFLAWLVARRRQMPGLGRLSGALGVAVGWVFLVGVVVPPATLAERLPAALAVAVLFAWLLSAPRLTPHLRPSLAALAVLLGWWLVGAPLSGSVSLRDAPLMALTAIWLLALAWVLLAADRWSLVAASLSLWASLHAVGAPAIWGLLAIVPAASCATGPMPIRPAETPPPVRKRDRKTRKSKPSMVVVPAAPDLSRLPVALALAIVAAAVMAASNQVRLHLGATDAACLAPAAAVVLMAWLRPKFGWLGPLSGAASTTATVALLALFAFSAAALTGLR